MARQRPVEVSDLGPAQAGMPWRTRAFRELNQPLARLLDEKAAKALAGLGVLTAQDLMEHLPRRYLSGTETTDLSEARIGSDAAIVAKVEHVARVGQEPRLRLEAVLTDGRARLAVTFFGRERLIKYWQHQLSLGVKGIFVGKVGVFRGNLQMSHPDFVMLDELGGIVGRATEERLAMARQVTRSGLVGIYPASAKLRTWTIAECADLVLDALKGLDDPLPASVRQRHHLPGLWQAYAELHRPASLERIADAERRLKFDEALRLQLAMAYRRADQARHRAAPVVPVPDGLLARFDARMPFTLTGGQREVSAEVFADLAQPVPMQRLLQGEVGSGKTLVALRAMLAAVDAGQQAVLLAPTEVLATQHYEVITSLLGDLAVAGTSVVGAGGSLADPLPGEWLAALSSIDGPPARLPPPPCDPPRLTPPPAPTSPRPPPADASPDATEVVLLTGSVSAIRRRNLLNKVGSGQVGLVIGTHAVLQAGVEFAHLGLVVVDEQHRFGVEQRAALSEGASGPDGTRPHVLVMTATPIPRSVAMTIFGDLSLSTLAELPSGRADVQTTLVATQQHPSWLDRAWQRVREEVAAGRQGFVIAPRINAAQADEVDPDDPGRPPSATVEALVEQLREGPLNGLRLEMMHGRLPASDKRDIMSRFAAGEVDVLVSTTVVEVGIDVAGASIMVIMDADRFGISQLHQLRGRIGRGEHPSVCLLVTAADPSGPAMERLAAVARTRDGFELAEVDLVQRREGNVLGASQAGGRSALRLLRVIADADLIAEARDVAADLVAADPDRADAGLADMVTQVESSASDDWLDRA